MAFSIQGVPKKHKTGFRSPISYRELQRRVPGVEFMEDAFAGIRGVLFCIKDRAGRYLCANPAFLRRTRTNDPKTLIGRTAKEVFPALLAAGYEQQDSAILEADTAMRDRLEMLTNPDGSLGWYLTDKVPIRDSQDHILAIACVSRDLQLPADNDPRIAQLADSIAYMKRHYANPIRIADLATRSQMSLSKFERLMRAILHVSPRQLLTQLRVEAAAERLRESELSLGMIALECGFCDQPTFCRQFKATSGMTASRYRKLSREGP